MSRLSGDSISSIFSECKTNEKGIITSAVLRNPLETKMFSFREHEINIYPENIGEAKKLEYLCIPYCRMQKIPLEVCGLKNLINIELVMGDLEILPPEIYNLHKLRVLQLEGNKIKHIPPGICGLKSLKLLDLSRNLISDGKFSGELAKIDKLNSVILHGNYIRVLCFELYLSRELIELTSYNRDFVYPIEVITTRWADSVPHKYHGDCYKCGRRYPAHNTSLLSLHMRYCR